jgi:signal transduction histidine kinase/ActR/RegA family two-component response regulator
MIEDVTERKQSEALDHCQKKALEMVAQGISLNEVLDNVILDVERQATVELRASIQILDHEGKKLRLLAAPSLPESCRQTLIDCCVNSQDAVRALAASQQRPLIIPDLAAAPEWAHFATMLEPYAIRSIWLTSIKSSVQRLLGTLCLYSSKPRTPSAAEQTMIENVTQTIALAIERKEFEAERETLLACEQVARAQAETANRAKDEFLAVVSHELRTPLNAIGGWTSLLVGGTLEEAARLRAFQSIQRQVRSQCQLIDDLLDVARIVSGKLSVHLQEVNPSKVIIAALDVLRPAAEAKRIQLVTDLDSTAVTVWADPERLQQVIWNLLSNAIKFTPELGRVETRLRRSGSNVEITVIDTGQGIGDDFLPYVFDRFRQADVSTTRTHGGIGLGLAIVRNLVELHGGTVFASSEGKGKGATFTVRLPVQADRESKPNTRGPQIESATSLPANAEKEILKGLRILVVEDNSEDSDVLVAGLIDRGATVHASSSAAAALTELERLPPDILVADIGMPGEDGYSLIRKIRSYPADRGGLTPAIALTAYSGDANRQLALEAGFQKHITKPADPDELARTIVQLARSNNCTSR